MNPSLQFLIPVSKNLLELLLNKTQIYEKSIVNSLQCYESSIEKENYTDAKICLRTWKTRTEELGKFDPDRYEEMKAAVEALKK